jgi:hypothetical protein
MDVQEPDTLGASLAAAQCDHVYVCGCSRKSKRPGPCHPAQELHDKVRQDQVKGGVP